VARPRVLVVASRHDLHAAAVHESLARRRVGVEWIDLASLSADLRIALVLDTDTPDVRIVTQDGARMALSDVDTIWWRDPRTPPDDPEIVGDERVFVQREWEHFVDGLEAVAPVRWVNRPSRNRLAGRKPFQLVAARAVGLRVPETIITNDPAAARDLIARGSALVYKRLGSAPRPLTATHALRTEDCERLDTLVNCPAILQERIDARYDIRVTAIGSDLHAAEIHSQAGASPLDWRFDHTVPFTRHQLGEETARRLRLLMDRLGLAFAAIDLRLTPDGEYVFLEVNPSGQYLFVEVLAGMPLSASLAEFLAGGA
jgi:hypothetical protein